MGLLIKHINRFTKDIDFNDFITVQAEVNYELLGKKEFHRIETTDPPEATIPVCHFLLYIVFHNVAVKATFKLLCMKIDTFTSPIKAKHFSINN